MNTSLNNHQCHSAKNGLKYFKHATERQYFGTKDHILVYFVFGKNIF